MFFILFGQHQIHKLFFFPQGKKWEGAPLKTEQPQLKSQTNPSQNNLGAAPMS